MSRNRERRSNELVLVLLFALLLAFALSITSYNDEQSFRSMEREVYPTLVVPQGHLNFDEAEHRTPIKIDPY